MKRVAILLYAALAALSCNNDVAGLGPPSDPSTETFAPALGVNISQMTRLPSGVYYRDVATGTGDEITEKSDTVWVTYGGFLKDGTLFDSGINTKFQPTNVVPGFRAGLLGMKVGGRRKVVIPSSQGYGGESVRDPAGKIIIPRQSTLIFDLEVIKVHTPAPAP
jgi:FKBP-type peptidyl-prolyl cis-trans isomerase FkpA